MELVFNGLWPRGLRHGAKDVGQTFVGMSLALLGSLGQCAFAHSIHALECPIENEEEEDEDDWRKENQMGVQWDEDAKLEEILQRRG